MGQVKLSPVPAPDPTVFALEMTEAPMLGWAGPTALIFWLVVLAYGWPASSPDRQVSADPDDAASVEDHADPQMSPATLMG